MDRLKDNRFAEFNKAFIKEIAPRYGYFEAKRRELLRKILPYFCTLILIPLIMFIILNIMMIASGIIGTTIKNEYDTTTNNFILIPLGIMCFGCLSTSIRQYVFEYKVFLKKEIMPYLLKAFGAIRWVNCKAPEGGSSKLDVNKKLPSNEFSEIQNSGLFLGCDYAIADDKFYGKYQNVKFKIYETVMKIKGNNSDKTAFRGLILLCNSNKKIKAKTIVSSKNTHTKDEGCLLSIVAFCIISTVTLILMVTFFGGFSNIFLPNSPVVNGLVILFLIYISIGFGIKLNPILIPGKIIVDDLRYVVLEDSKFSKRFKVYSKDQVEGRYLVTPAFMERLYNLKTEFGNRQTRCAFYDNRFMVAIETRKDFFEFGNIFKPVHDGLNIYQFYRQIRAIYDMIDYFKLNENIYLK